MSETKKNKPETITSKPTVKEAQKAVGLYNVKYIKDHGNSEKGDTAEMHHSTAKALKAHGIVEIGEKINVIKKVKR